MIEMATWLDTFLKTLDTVFSNRIWFVGLQGSYARDEATEDSDIDVVVVLDDLSALDIQTYGAMLDTLPHREKICGFLSGKEELLNWEPSDLFQFYHDTKPIHGSLDELLSKLDDSAVNRAIKVGVCNIYHSCVHNMLHENSDGVLINLYKSASFVVQAICFRQIGIYIRHIKDLLEVAEPEDGTILEIYLGYKNSSPVSFKEHSEILFDWAKKWIAVHE